MARQTSQKRIDDYNRLSGELYVSSPLVSIFRILQGMPYCPLSQHITEREKVEIYKIAKMLDIEWPDELTWQSYIVLIGSAYKAVGEIGLYTKITEREADKLYQKLVEEGG